MGIRVVVVGLLLLFLPTIGRAQTPFPFTDSLTYAAATTSSTLPTFSAPAGGTKAATQARAKSLYNVFGRLKAWCQVPELEGSVGKDTVSVELFQRTGTWQRAQSPPGTDVRWPDTRQHVLTELIGDSLRLVADTAQSSAVKIRCTFY